MLKEMDNSCNSVQLLVAMMCWDKWGDYTAPASCDVGSGQLCLTPGIEGARMVEHRPTGGGIAARTSRHASPYVLHWMKILIIKRNYLFRQILWKLTFPHPPVPLGQKENKYKNLKANIFGFPRAVLRSRSRFEGPAPAWMKKKKFWASVPTLIKCK